MKRTPFPAIVIVSVLLAVLGRMALAQQDKYTVQTPNGLAFSEFRGYEDWQVIAVSHTEDPAVIKVEVANPVMIAAYRAGIPGNGRPFPDGSMIAKIEWNAKKSTDAPFSVWIPGTQKDVDFIMKDSKRFPDTHGWAYAEFAYDAASDTFTPTQRDAKCGAACHEIAAAKDYIFTTYGHR
jgi:hypothetical protein